MPEFGSLVGAPRALEAEHTPSALPAKGADPMTSATASGSRYDGPVGLLGDG
ncbi:MAG TPA: hypothetical protein RMH99_28760 [Sandaracinaceae bacterium LLY-WYZ-13_1]|nr:hypothetical protein [Sandaracinaceae bacterium LLY-WYZ-13_1]